jgi:hypothetical protein
MKIRIDKIISFYDDKVAEDSKHASAITALVGEDLAAGLMKHYFDNNNNSCEILIEKPTEGTRKGKWLDRWLKVSSYDTTTFYQTEIKNWSSHSIAGQRILVDATEQAIIDFAHNRFSDQWNAESETLRYHYVAKVLKKMRSINAVDVRKGKIEPLICYWYPILKIDTNSLTPFFCTACKGDFDKVNFFSLSIYLRKLYMNGDKVIDIDMPYFEQRIMKLKAMYDFGSSQ